MATSISSSQLSASLKQICTRVQQAKEHFVVSKYGQPVFAIVPIREYERNFLVEPTPEERATHLHTLQEGFVIFADIYEALHLTSEQERIIGDLLTVNFLLRELRLHVGPTPEELETIENKE